MNYPITSTFPTNSSYTNSTIAMEMVKRYLATSQTVSAVTPVIVVTILVIGVVGNITVIYVTFSTQRVIKRQFYSVLVVNLAIADLVYLISSAPYQAVVFSVSQWNYGSFLCSFLHFLNIQTMSVSIFTMSSLAITRFVALVLPFKMSGSFFQTSELLSALLVIATVWVAGTGVALPNALSYELLDHSSFASNNNEGKECNWRNEAELNVYRTTLFVVTFALPLLLVILLYSFIIREVFCFMRRNDVEKDYMKTTCLILLLVLTFLGCWFPYHCYSMMLVSNQYQSFYYATERLLMKVFALSFSYAHACVNPVIYTFAAPSFRTSIIASCSSRKCLSGCYSGSNELISVRHPTTVNMESQPTLSPDTKVMAETPFVPTSVELGDFGKPITKIEVSSGTELFFHESDSCDKQRKVSIDSSGEEA